MSKVDVIVKGLNKSFGSNHVLRGVDIEIHAGQVLALVGPSGSGKSTFLRCLNLLEMPDSGTIHWNGEDVPYKTMSPLQLSEHRVRMAMVFQHFNLFPHRTAIQNVTEGPVHVLGRSADEAGKQAMELLDRVGLADKADHWPPQLSGGQKQRVAIARALAMDPQVLLLDEVTSALDVEIVAGINGLLAELAKGGMTMVMVTHDLRFARSVGDQLVFMDEGKIVESGTPDALIESPQSPRLNEFLAAVL